MQHRKRSNKVAVVVIVTVILWAAYAVQPVPLQADSKGKINEVIYIAKDYTFTGPDSLPAGMTTLRIENKGSDLHQIQIVRLTEGKTTADFEAALKADPMAMKLPGWVKFFGGPNGTVPGEANTATVNLEPGNYLITCLIPDQKGVAHAGLGMIKPLTVTTAANPVTADRKADGVVDSFDFSFSVSKPFTVGKQTIKVVNKGTRAHEVQVIQLPPHAQIQDFGKYFLPDAKHDGPPPGKPIGGVSGIEKGAHAYFIADLTPGRYGLICFLTEAGQFHFTKGMMMEFTVK